jgi:hypothetical protein
MTMHIRSLILFASLFAGAMPAVAQNPATGTVVDTAINRKLAALPAELPLADGSLRVINLYKLQGVVLHETAGAPSDRAIERLVREVYAPYTRFWAGYLGDEAAFRAWVPKLLEPGHEIHSRLEPLLDVALDRRFIESVEWIERTTGRRPDGTWYIVFGPGWTDMGGMGEIGMVADFTRMQPDSTSIANLLPHELAHQVHGSSRTNDPDAGTVLHRMISEGFASYVAWVYSAGARTPAQALGYTEEEWSWAVEHERELFDAVRGIIDSHERRDSDRIAARREHLIPGSPGAAGYFLGFRMVQAYVAAHGEGSWMGIFDLPVREVLAATAAHR